MSLTAEDLKKIDEIVTSRIRHELNDKMKTHLEDNNDKIMTKMLSEFPHKGDLRIILKEEIAASITPMLSR